MKIFVECKDIMLQKTMELFLKDYLHSKKECDFIVCDEKLSHKKAQFIIGDKAFLKIPFSKEKLFENLDEFYSVVMGNQNSKDKTVATDDFEKKLDKIMGDFKTSLLELFNEYKNKWSLYIL